MTQHQPRDYSAAERMRDISLPELLRSHGFEIKSEGITFRARRGGGASNPVKSQIICERELVICE